MGNDRIFILYIRSACERLRQIEDLDGGEHKGKTKYQGRQLKLQEVADDCDSHWLNGNCGSSRGGKSWMVRRQMLWPRVHTSTQKAYTAPAGQQELWLCLQKQTIGLANKLVQFKKRPLYSCSLKAAYTKTYEKNLWYKEFQNTKNFTSTFKSILLYIHKRGCKIKMTEKERRSKVMEVDLSSYKGGRDAPNLHLSCSCQSRKRHPFLSPPFSPVAWKHNYTIFLQFLELKTLKG